MTMQIKVGQQIAGVDPKLMRDLLRRCHRTFCLDWLRVQLEISKEDAAKIVSALVSEGFIEPDRQQRKEDNLSPCYATTKKGDELVRASAAKRIRRETAKAALQAFMDRVHQINSNPHYLMSVTKVAVFGSFLTASDLLGDVDVGIEMKYRPGLNAKDWDMFREHARKSGRAFSSLQKELDWPRREVLLALKAHRRTISIHSWYSFTYMDRASDFRYEVLLGNPQEIRSELKKAARERGEDAKPDSRA